jgi:hypothetical protein
MTVQVQGTLTPEGTLVLDEKPALPPGRVSVRLEPLEPSLQNAERLPSDNKADWEAAMQAANELEDYDFDAFQRQRDYDLQHAKDHMP